MTYEYNGHLTFEERIEEISKQIEKEYSIDKDLALKIATLEDPITTDDIINAKYKRYSNILKLCSNNEIVKNKVISDIFKDYKDIKGKYEKIDIFVSDLTTFLEYNTNIPEYK